MLPYEKILTAEEQAVFALRELYQRYGYMPYRMSRFEEYDLYVRNKDFLLSEDIITFTDRSGRLLALKPDVTLSIIRSMSGKPGTVQKLYYHENVYRTDANHTFREIPQSGLECIGDLGSYEIAEVVTMAVRSLSLLGRPFLLNLSHMGLVSAVFSQCGVPDGQRQALLHCLQQKNGHELAELCAQAGIAPENTAVLRRLVDASGSEDAVFAGIGPLLKTEEAKLAAQELKQICRVLEAAGFGAQVRVDFSVGNDLRYYSGVVFNGYLQGVPDSILSGGQYDKLLRKMRLPGKAIGFALYVDLLAQRQPAARVDTLLLHDGTADPVRLMAAAEEAAKAGSVLVSTRLPEGCTWKTLVKLSEKEG